MYSVKKQFIASKRKVYSMKSIKYVALPQSLKYTSSSTLSLLIHSERKTVAEKVIGDI